MELINQFKKTLLETGDSVSRVTVKNYTADVKKFISWFEANFERSFPPPALPLEIVETYLAPLRSSSPRSAKRYQSSLRKFFAYLLEQGRLSYNPLAAKQVKAVNPDPLHLKEFSNYLYTSNASPVTIKNYILDVRQFLNWAGEMIGASQDLLAKIDTFLLEEYKNRLINEAGLSPVSVNRKLSSLRRYISWAADKGLLKNKPEVASLDTGLNSTPDSVVVSDLSDLSNLGDLGTSGGSESLTSEPSLSRFGPFRLFQKGKRALNFIFDSLVILSILKTIEAIKYNLWKATGRQIFAPIPEVIKSLDNSKTEPLSFYPERVVAAHFTILDRFITIGKKATIGRIPSIPKSIYAPFKISTDALPFWRKILFHLKHTRPKWYKRYHSYTFVHYLHFAILLIFASFAGFKIYQLLNTTPPQAVLAAKVSPGRLISFRGRLNDSADTPITKPSIVRFAIYNSQTGSGPASTSAITSTLWQENQTVKPDQTGTFTTTLGKINKIDQDIFSNNPNLYLGISVGSDPELTPRQELANTGLTKNAEELQGLKPITGNNAGTENVILALDSSGNLTIGGNAHPVFQATGGELKLTGQQLTLATNEGSNTNIVLNPDGTGIIDIRKPLQNTSNTNNTDLSGAVKIDDNLAISATSSAQSALVINQNGTGDLISALTNGSAKFTVSNSGTVTVGEDLKVLGNNLETITGTFSLANTNTLNLNIGGAATSISLGAKTGSTTINHSLNVAGIIKAEGGIIIPTLPAGSIPFIGPSSQFTAENTSLFWDATNKRLGVGTSTPGSKLSVVGMSQGSGTSLVIDASGNILQSSSSRRYKDSIQNFAVDFEKILDATPVSFRYKDTGSFNIGYIAEDFDQLGLKDLVIYNKQGQPDAIKYDRISLYLLEIVKKQQIALAELRKNAQNAKTLEKLVLSGQNFLSTLESGALEVRKISTDSLSVATENITIGTQTLREYISSIVNEILDKRLARLAEDWAKRAQEKQKTIVVVSPLAEVSAETSANTELEAKPTQYVTLTPTPSPLIPSPSITNITNVYNNASASAAPTASISATPSPSPVIEPSPVASESATTSPILTEANQTQNTQTTQQAGVSDSQTLRKSDITDSLSLPSFPKIQTTPANIASFSAELSYVPNLKSDFGTFNLGLIALGPTSLSETSISTELTIGSNLKISENSINTIGSDLNLQPLRQGNLSLMGGLVTVDTEGNLKVEGNAEFAKDVSVRGTLAAGVISPLAGSDSVQIHADLVASGSGKFMRISTNSIKIVRGAQADTSFTETIASGSAGTAVITANETERTIITPFVTENSLIYITPVTDTKGTAPYIARQTAENPDNKTRGSFTIQIPRTVNSDIKINWWIIN